jgi:hypothetical protein
MSSSRSGGERGRDDGAQNGVAVALSRPEHGPETVEDERVKPDQFFAAFVGLVLALDAAERERPGNRLERLDGDLDRDHATLRLVGITLSAIPPANLLLFAAI